MGVFDIFSKRQKRAQGEVPDVYSYDPIPRAFRVQVVHIWGDAFGADPVRGRNDKAEMFREMRAILAREYGKFALADAMKSPELDMTTFFLSGSETPEALDVIELTFRAIGHLSSDYRYYTNAQVKAEGAIDELNQRFREHGLGYQFEGNQIIRLDAQFTHQEMTKPALLVLGDPAYRGPDEEFRRAHEHYLHGNMKESLNEALKAFESTMKVICGKRGWKLSGKETAKNLIQVCADNKLFPDFMLAHYNALLSTLESGVPTVRNKLGGHGQGKEVVPVPGHFVAYQLNLTASAILFLVRCCENLK